MTEQNTAYYEHPASGASGSAQASFTVQSEPALSMGKWVMPASEVSLHSNITYTMMLTNTGGLAAGTSLTDALPAAVDFVEWVEQNGAEVDGDTITWRGAIPGGGAVRFVWVAQYMTDTGDSVTNTVEYRDSISGQNGSAEAVFTIEDYIYYLPILSRLRSIW